MLEHGDEPIVFVEGQAAQHDGIDDGENGRAGADAERQNSQRNGRERWRGAQRAQSCSKVVEHVALDGVTRDVGRLVFATPPAGRIRTRIENRSGIAECPLAALNAGNSKDSTSSGPGIGCVIRPTALRLL